MDLRIEQPIHSIKTFIGHARRNDNAGKCLLTALYDTQLEAGVSCPFYKTDVNKYKYVTKNTRWHYIWQICHEYDIDLCINGMWLPSSNYSNNSCLMERAVQDNLLQRKGKMEVINNCRMYTGAVFISDLLQTNKCIDKNFLTGKKRLPQHQHEYAGIRQPPEAAWDEWKDFIFRNYLIN